MENAQRDDITIQQLRIFALAAQSGSFSAAAQQLYITQPTVSKWIAKLERQMNCRLFTRQGGRVKLTVEGEALLDYWRRLLKVYDDSVVALERMEGRKRALRVGILTHLRFEQVLGEIQRRYAAQNPDVDVVLEAYDFKELRFHLLNGDLDVAYAYSFDFEEDEAGISILPIRRAELYLAGMPEAMENRESEGYHTLLLISRSESRRGGDLVMDACQDMGFEFDKVLYFPNVASVELAARQGKGVMMCNKHVLQKNDPMLRFAVPKEFVSNDLALAYPSDLCKPSAMALVRCVEEYVRDTGKTQKNQ